jgi:ferrochelatase
VPLGKKTAVVLLNLGGPSSEEEIHPFLFSLFYDPSILSLPNPFRYLLAKLIAWRRLIKARHIYAHLGGRSPLLKNTQAQALALEATLGEGYRVVISMRHAAPFTQDALQAVRAYGPDEIVLLPLYPQYSTTTTESSLREWKKKGGCHQTPPTRFIPSYAADNGFLGALGELTLPRYREAQRYGSPRVLLTAHGLPEKIVAKGDPYRDQAEKTAAAFREKLCLKDATLCYQSRVGPLKWIGPSLEEEIIKASREKKPLVIVPLSFVSEHSETLVELDITLKALALKEGCPAYERVPTVQTHPLFIEGLACLVRSCQNFLVDVDGNTFDNRQPSHPT